MIFPIPAITAKLNQTKVVNIVKIDHQLNISPEKTNFSPNKTSADSGHKTIKNIASSTLKTVK
ncbi:TPA: hypothetical protein DIC40_05450 [Patescibacteria group bacterium]|nr:hypothetical protein [Candidatus Gracilibacteria bacterium]